MRIIAKSSLRRFWESGHPGAKVVLEDCHRVVFNIAGNKYRLVAAIDYRRGLLFVKFVGTHRQYDQINAKTVSLKDQP